MKAPYNLRIRLSLGQKINLSYTLVTLVALLTLAAVGGLAVTAWINQGCRVWQSGAQALQTQLDLSPPPLTPPSQAEAWLAAFFQHGTVRSHPGLFLELGIDFRHQDIPLAALISADGRIAALSPATGSGQQARLWPAAFAPYRPPRLQGQRPLVATRGAFCLVAVPWEANRHPGGWLVFLYQRPSLTAYLGDWVLLFLLLTLPIAPLELLLGTLVGWLFSRAFVRRFRHIASTAEAWAEGDFSATVADTGNDEIGILARRLNTVADRLRRLLRARQELAVLEERQRLSRELHDAVKQKLFAASMQLAAAREQWQQAPSQALENFDDGLILLQQAQQELTGLLYQLRPVDLQNKPLTAALEDILSAWERRTGIQVNRTLALETPLPSEVEEAILRIVQEGLANVVRHSAADRVALHLEQRGKAIHLALVDNGRGFDPQNPPHEGQGLQNMAARAARLGSVFHVKSAPGQGTCLDARFPLPAEGEAQ